MSADRRPWFERTYRWGQTNLTEIDPERYDHALWERQWERTAVEGVIINAGGIIAYYPSELPFHFRSPFLGDRDLFGEITDRARARSLTVVARMDCNRADDRFYGENPDWFCVDADGVPYRATGRFISCIHSHYYSDYIPQILTEIVGRYSPDGFADNSWSGLSRDKICYCRNCATAFAARAEAELPARHDWSDPLYREWIEWNYDRRIEIWDHFNEVTTSAGGPDCRWIGMNSAQMSHQAEHFRDLGRIADRTPMVFIDHQRRSPAVGFQENSHTGKLVHDLLGWQGHTAESMAMYNHYIPSFRTASAPEPEARMWAVSGIAGGILPWWHHIGAAHEDERQYETAPPLWSWHQGAEEYLVDRMIVANVGVLWSQRSFDFYGRDDGRVKAEDPYNGMLQVFLRERIPYRPVHVDRLAAALEELEVLVLPNVSALSDGDVEAIRQFVHAGGGLVATGETSLYDEHGEPREDFALAELFGATTRHRHHGDRRLPEVSWEASPSHTYLQLAQPWEKGCPDRHPVLDRFENTNQLPFGGRVECVEPRPGAQVLATFVAPFPAYPPETSWQRHPATSVPAVVANELGGRVVYLPADLDRCFGRGLQPDHARLLGNAIRWAARGRLPATYGGTGTVDLQLYRQRGRHVLHLVNLSAAGAWRLPMHEDIPIGPIDVVIDREVAGLPEMSEFTARALVSDEELTVVQERTELRITVPHIVDHEVLVLEARRPGAASTPQSDHRTDNSASQQEGAGREDSRGPDGHWRARRALRGGTDAKGPGAHRNSPRGAG